MTGLLTKPELEFHEVASIFPMMSAEEFKALKASILKNGQRVPIYTHEGKIVDGRNRYMACLELGVVPHFEEWNGEGLLCDFVWDLNAERRDLGTGAKQMAAARYAIELEKESRARQLSGLQNVGSSCSIEHDEEFGRSVEKAADKFSVGRETVKRAVKVEKQGDESLKQAVEAGRASVSAAAEVATLPVAEQAEIVAKGEAEILAAAKRIKAERAGLVRGTFGTGENEWYTPAQYIDTARKVLGRIDLDPASSEIANETVKAAEFYTSHDNGLTRDWHGNVWLNPPYSQPSIAQFADKMVEEWQAQRADAAIVLTHNYTDTAWFQKLASHATAICFTRGRVRFVSADGEVASPTQGQAFFYFGSDLARFIEEFREIGFVVEVR